MGNEHARIDFRNEQLVSISDAARVLPHRRDGKRIHVATLYRWASRGLRGSVLETIRIGGRRFTSVEALQRFFDRLSHPDRPVASNRRLEDAERELDSHGL